VLTYGHGVERFTLDPSLGEFVMTAENMRIPEQGKTIYSINEGQFSYFAALFLLRKLEFCILVGQVFWQLCMSPFICEFDGHS